MNRGIIYAFLSVLFMSFGPIFNKYALTGSNGIVLSFGNSIFATFFSVLMIFYKKNFKFNNKLKFFMLAGLFNAIAIFVLFLGLENCTPGSISLLNRSYIIFSIFLGSFLLGEKIKKNEIALISLLFLGMVLFSVKQSQMYSIITLILGLLSGLFFCLCNLVLKKYLLTQNKYLTLAFLNFTSLIVSLPILLFRFNTNLLIIKNLSISSIGFMCVGALFGSVLGLYFFYKSMEKTEFYKINLIRCFGPFICYFFSLCFFPEKLEILNIIGGLLIVISITYYGIDKFISGKRIDKTLLSKNIDLKFDTHNKDDIFQFNSVLVLIKKDSKWLMVKNRNRGWEFPGGHAENGETYIETAIREVEEEAKVLIKNVRKIGWYRLLNRNNHTTIIVSAEVDRELGGLLNFETMAKKWVKKLPKNLSFDDGLYEQLVLRF